jgi:hypothetical protein
LKIFPALFLVLATIAAPALAEEAPFSVRANALCRELIDARDHALFSAGKSESLDLVLGRLQNHDAPGMDDREHLARTLEAMAKDLASARDRLGALPTDDPQMAADLALFVEKADYHLTVFETRIAALRAVGSLAFPTEAEIDAPDPDPRAWDEATIRLGFARRDCERVFSSNGNPPGHAAFIAAAAPVCAAIDHGFGTDLDPWRDIAMNGFIAVHEGTLPEAEAVEAYRAMAHAWTQAAWSLADVEASGEVDPALWEATLEMITTRAQIFAARANAIETGDLDFIKQIFERRPELPDFRAHGLEETSCMAVAERF